MYHTTNRGRQRQSDDLSWWWYESTAFNDQRYQNGRGAPGKSIESGQRNYGDVGRVGIHREAARDARCFGIVWRIEIASASEGTGEGREETGPPKGKGGKAEVKVSCRRVGEIINRRSGAKGGWARPWHLVDWRQSRREFQLSDWGWSRWGTDVRWHYAY